MIVTYGTVCPKGHLPVYSVNTELEAQQLIARCCEMVWVGREKRLGYIALELEDEQSLENLYSFGRRLDAEYHKMKEEERS